MLIILEAFILCRYKMAKFILFKRLNPQAIIPSRMTVGSAGWDLSAPHEVLVPARDRICINTGIAVGMPEGCYGRIASRSGLASRHGLQVGAGVIDPDFNGTIGVLLYNHSDEDYWVNKMESKIKYKRVE